MKTKSLYFCLVAFSVVIASMTLAGQITCSNEVSATHFQPTDKNEILRFIKEESRKNKVNPKVMIAIAKVESSVNPLATNWGEKTSVPSRGVFQIQDTTAQSQCQIEDPNDLYGYKANTRCAVKYLRILLDRHNQDYIKAIVSYNAGGYYLCKPTHIEKGVDCQLGFPVNLSYFLKVQSAI